MQQRNEISPMDRRNADYIKDLMVAYMNGHTIEMSHKNNRSKANRKWEYLDSPQWNFYENDYRVRVEPKEVAPIDIHILYSPSLHAADPDTCGIVMFGGKEKLEAVAPAVGVRVGLADLVLKRLVEARRAA